MMHGRTKVKDKDTLKTCIPYTAVSFLTENCKLLKTDSVTFSYLLGFIDNKSEITWKEAVKDKLYIHVTVHCNTRVSQ